MFVLFGFGENGRSKLVMRHARVVRVRLLPEPPGSRFVRAVEDGSQGLREGVRVCDMEERLCVYRTGTISSPPNLREYTVLIPFYRFLSHPHLM